ncbi:unnamed protein product, partial [Allacma fusca]
WGSERIGTRSRNLKVTNRSGSEKFPKFAFVMKLR